MTRTLKIVLLVFIVLVCLVPTGLFAFSITGKLYRWYNPYLDQQLAGPTTITSSWLEIAPNSPMRVERQRHLVALDLDKSIHTEDEGSGLVLPDGSVVRPQVELVDEDGKTYELNLPSGFFSTTESFWLISREKICQRTRPISRYAFGRTDLSAATEFFGAITIYGTPSRLSNRLVARGNVR